MNSKAPTTAPHQENHRTKRIGWLRASVMGANDGIVSTASLIIGVAAAQSRPQEILIAGTSALVAGAMSMAAGEYVSVSSQADTEQADLAREQKELEDDPEAETEELASLYARQGLDPSLARQVAEQLMEKDALAAHAREELGISEMTAARPVQAALASAATFSVGAGLPLITILIAPQEHLIPAVAVASLGLLALLGALGAQAGGANITRGTLRVTFWGMLAMGLTAAIGFLTGIAV